jgi:hypothetical protein
MFFIKFIKDDELNGQLISAGEEKKVSRSIRDAKVGSGVAKEVTNEPKSTKKK